MVEKKAPAKKSAPKKKTAPKKKPQAKKPAMRGGGGCSACAGCNMAGGSAASDAVMSNVPEPSVAYKNINAGIIGGAKKKGGGVVGTYGIGSGGWRATPTSKSKR